jgi:hypothetical protein
MIVLEVAGPALRAAALLHALARQRPLRRGNQQVALAAMLQFLAINGWDLDPGPARARRGDGRRARGRHCGHRGCRGLADAAAAAR